MADRRAAKIKGNEYTPEEAAAMNKRLEAEANEIGREGHASGFKYHTAKQTDQEIAALK